ncbi:phosphatase PAP2 family protein [Brevibacterium album]|uniref:phosphatase PAP2 family protein n=1 Tax=Brevibacterium album TaxID=417948 RepID=UPI00054D0F1C|nr:phosphatase PAP2 family protein [Brevibacterium album]
MRRERARPLAAAVSVLLAVVAVLGVWVLVSPAGGTPLDLWWHDAVLAAQTSVVLTLSHVLDHVGAGPIGVFAVPLLIAALLWWRHGWRAAVFALTAFAASALTVQAVKHLVARARPEDMLVASDFGSFPSGHTANAATVAVVLWLLFPRVPVLLAGILWTALMAFSRTALAVHWLTDTVAGAALGAAVALLCGMLLLPVVQRTEQSGGSGS